VAHEAFVRLLERSDRAVVFGIGHSGVADFDGHLARASAEVVVVHPYFDHRAVVLAFSFSCSFSFCSQAIRYHLLHLQNRFLPPVLQGLDPVTDLAIDFLDSLPLPL
jgi:hypothetical protein